MYAWGSNSHGQLGLGDYVNQVLPQRVRVKDKKTGTEVNLNFLDVDCGARHTIALTSTGDVYTMGSSEFGQLGTGSLQSEVVPTKVEFYSRIRKISAGESHTLALTENGKIYAAGCNQTGQLGIGNRKSSLVFVKVAAKENLRFKKVSAGSFSAAFCTRGELYLWGAGVFGEFLTPQKIGEFKFALKRLSVGTNFGCGVDSKGNIYSWGANTHGELGTGELEQQAEPQIIPALQGKKITSVCCGRNFVIALGVTVQNPQYQQEKNATQAVVFENESRRLSEKERFSKTEFQPAKENYYKERYAQIEKALNESKNLSFERKERGSANMNRSFESNERQRKNRSRSASLNERDNETRTVQQGTKKVSFENTDRVHNEENEGETRGRQRSSSLRRSGRHSSERDKEGTREQRSFKDQDSFSSQRKEKSPRKVQPHIDTRSDNGTESKEVPTANFNVQNSENFKSLTSKDDENLDLSNKFVYERIVVNGEKRGQHLNPAPESELKERFGGYYQPRAAHFPQSQPGSDQPQHDPKLRQYEEIIEKNKEEILALKDTVVELKRQLFEVEQNKAKSIMLQERIHGQKMDGMEETWKEMQQVMKLSNVISTHMNNSDKGTE